MEMDFDFAAELRAAEERAGFIHLDGVPWWEAPVPRRWHRCWAQTTSTRYRVQRCACGGMRTLGEHHWAFKNERRRERA